MPQETRPHPIIGGPRIPQPDGELQREFGEGPSLVKPRVVPMVLNHAGRQLPIAYDCEHFADGKPIDSVIDPCNDDRCVDNPRLDAFLYFKFASKAHKRELELLEFWAEQHKHNKHKAEYR